MTNGDDMQDLHASSRAAAIPPPAELVLDVRHLSVALTLGDETVNVIEDVSFSVARGEILGVVGESGSGKSITALSVMQMLPKAAKVIEGSIEYRGRDLLGLQESAVQKLRGGEIGMVFQDPMAFLNPLMTVGQQLREVLRLHGASKKDAAVRAVELLQLVGVRDAENRVDAFPHEFSGGMRQRVIIALAVANNPTLLIADEPTTALDVTVQAGVLQLLTRLRDQLGMGLVLITHDIQIVREVCDSVMVMYGGRVLERGPVEEVFANPRQPYTRELMRSTPRLDAARLRRLSTIPGQPPDVLRRPGGCPFHPRCPLAVDRCRTEMPPLARWQEQKQEQERPHDVACWRAADADAITLEPDTTPFQAVDAERTPILQIVDARVAYGRKSLWSRSEPNEVVKGVSLTAYRGRTLGLVGESGCGKSTLARTIVGLQPLAGGTITIADKEWGSARSTGRRELRRVAQMVFQDPYSSLNPRHTIRDILTEPLVVHDIVPRVRRDARLQELISLVGLPKSVLDRYSYQLSGGQRQRVGIARALAMEPQLIVADEPVSALDVSVQAQIVNLLADLRDELGLALVVIAHDLSVVRHLCDEVAVMQGGRIVELADSETLFTQPQHPYTRSLLEAAPGSPWAAAAAPEEGVA